MRAAQSAIRSLIIRGFARWHANDGVLETAISGITLYRCSVPTELSTFFYVPRFSVALQGTKCVVLDDEEYV